jgi:hypothetical protein
MEIWKDIIGYEGFYQVSNQGRIKSFYKNSKLIDKVNKIKSLKLAKDGYYNIQLIKNTKSRIFRVHRLVAVAFIPNLENKLEINHKDGIKTNNSIENLEWCTRSENMKHAVKTGLFKPIRGDSHTNSKLNETKVRLIRKLYYEDKIGQIDIAKRLNVNKNAVSGVITWRTWFYIDPHLKEYYKNIKSTKHKNKQ